MSSIEFIEKYEGTKNIYVRKNENKIDRFKKLTHLHLNGKRIEKIGDLSTCIHLKVLYLHNNALHRIENLTKLTQLTHLYLQWNQIERIENLNSLKYLRTLFLGNNKISKLENLEKLVSLEELHIERQRLNEGTEFVFDLGCLDLLSRKLRVLNVTGLGLTNLYFLPTLQCLNELIAAENRFECPTEIGESIRNIPFLHKVEFRGCPAQKDIHYKEKLMAKAPNIKKNAFGQFHEHIVPRHEMLSIYRMTLIQEIETESLRSPPRSVIYYFIAATLDGKVLSGNTRTFIQNMQDRGSRKMETNGTPTKNAVSNNLSLPSFSFDPSYCTQIESIAYQSWNSLHPKNLSKKYAKQTNSLIGKQKTPEIETKSVELLHGKLLPTAAAARPKKC